MNQDQISWEDIEDQATVEDLFADRICQIEARGDIGLTDQGVQVAFQLDLDVTYRAAAPEGVRYEVNGNAVTALDDSGGSVDLTFWALNKNSGVLVLPSEGHHGLSPDGSLLAFSENDDAFDVEATFYPEPGSFLKVSKKNDPPKFKSFSNEENESLFLGKGFGQVSHDYSKTDGYLLKPSGTYMLAKWIDPELEWKAGRRLRIIDAAGQERAAVFVYFKTTPSGFLVLPLKSSPL